MTNISAITHSHNRHNTSLSTAEVIAWSCAFASEAVVIVVGNLLTVVLFAFNKKLRTKKSLYLVMNMAFADLVLGGVCLPICVYFLVAHRQFEIDEKTPTFFTIILVVFSQASFITAALISAERFYAVYWPLKHRTLSTRAYRLVILTVWTLAFLVPLFKVFLQQFLSPVALNSLHCLFFVFVVLIISGLNIGVWRKFQQNNVPHQQNRTLQKRRLTKTLSFVSGIALGSWIPTIVYNLIAFLGYKISNNIFLVTFCIYYLNSFINPIVYALRIPDFKQALSLRFFTRKEMMGTERNTGRDDLAAALTLVIQRRTLTADHSTLQLTFEQEIVDDTKL